MKSLEAVYLESGLKSTLIEHVIMLIRNGDTKSALIDLDTDFDKIPSGKLRSYCADKILPSSSIRSPKYPKYLKYLRRIAYKSSVKPRPSGVGI